MSAKPKSHIEIRVSCNGLKNADVTSKSDPCCVMYVKSGDEWTEFARTETIQNNLNPVFERSFQIDYVFDDVQIVKFEVYDIDNKSEKLTDDDFLGELETTVAEIVSENPLTRQLNDKKGKTSKATISLRVMEGSVRPGPQEVLQLSFRAQKLENKDTFGKSDPFLELSRKTWDDKWEVVLRTEVVNNNLNPQWKPLTAKAHLLSGGDYTNEIKVDCKDWDKNGKHELIGSFKTSVAELIKHKSGKEWPCINEAKVGKKKYENSGVIFLTSCEVATE
jgi:Ca2+-dependent lipid-binding protein